MTRLQLKNIELLGKDDGSGFNREWNDLKSNRELMIYLLSQRDHTLEEIILRDNDDLRNLVRPTT